MFQANVYDTVGSTIIDSESTPYEFLDPRDHSPGVGEATWEALRAS